MRLDGHCLCGGVTVTLARQPAMVNICYCSDCQRRSGSPFGMAVWLAETDVTITGESRQFDHVSDKGRTLTNRFCPTCGSTIAFAVVLNPGLVAIPAGLFADPTCPPPSRSVFEESRHPWVAVPEGAARLQRGRDGRNLSVLPLKGERSSPTTRSTPSAGHNRPHPHASSADS